MDQNLKKEMDVHLASIVETYPILWDCTWECYKRADLKPEAWNKVATEVGAPASVNWAVKRWKAMKDTFQDNFRKVRESKRSGVGTDDIFKPTWFLYKHLTFLIKTCAQAQSTSNLDNVPSPTPSNLDCVLASTEPVLPGASGPIYNDSSLKKFFYIPPDSSELVEVEDRSVTVDSEVESNDSSIDNTFSTLVSPGPSSSSQVASSQFLSDMPPPCRPQSAPPQCQGTKRAAQEDDHFFNKKGSAKKNSNMLLLKAVQAMEKIAAEPATPTVPIPVTSPTENVQDSFANFIAERLKSMDVGTRKVCENEILQVLLKY